MFGAGITSDVFGVLWATTIQREIPERALSRISSYDRFGAALLSPQGHTLRTAAEASSTAAASSDVEHPVGEETAG